MKTNNHTILATGVGDSVPSTTSCSHFILRAYKYRIYPDESQRVMLAKHFGCCRYAYNKLLDIHNEMHEISGISPSLFEMHRLIAEMRKDADTQWLSEVYGHSLQAALRHLDLAFKKFYKALKEGKAEPVVKNGVPTGRLKYEPRFKSKKDNYQSVTFPDYVKVRDGKLILPKFKTPIKMRMHRPLGGEIRHAVVSRNAQGKYYVSILCLEECECLPQNNNAIGVDLGIKELAVCSNGERVANPKFLEVGEKYSKYLHRQISKKAKGGENRRRARMVLSRHYEKVANRRRDYTHKFTTRIVRENQTVCVEDLNVQGMESNHHLAKSVSSAAFGEIVRQLEYKSKWYGREFIKVGRWYPSSKTCHHCGYINRGLTLKDRVWVCAGCGREIDRDFNASENIRDEGIRILSGCGTQSDGKQKGGEALCPKDKSRSRRKFCVKHRSPSALDLGSSHRECHQVSLAGWSQAGRRQDASRKADRGLAQGYLVH